MCCCFYQFKLLRRAQGSEQLFALSVLENASHFLAGTRVGWTENDPALPLGWKGLQVQKTLPKVIKLYPGLAGAGVCTKFNVKILLSRKELEGRL